MKKYTKSFLLDINSKRAKIAKRTDFYKKAKNTYHISNTKGVKKWINNPSRYDIYGIDAPSKTKPNYKQPKQPVYYNYSYYFKQPALSKKEKDMIKDYTAGGFEDINTNLRKHKGNINELHKTVRGSRSNVRTLKSAIDKLPNYKGNLYRRLLFWTKKEYEDYKRSLQGKKYLTINSFWSTTASIDYSRGNVYRLTGEEVYAGKSDKIYHGVFIKIKTTGGRGNMIGNLHSFDDPKTSPTATREKEVVFTPGTKFKILSMKEQIKGKGKILILELLEM